MDKIISIFLAKILDGFKAKNPKLWGIVAVILLIVQFAIVKGNAYGLFDITGIVKDALQLSVTLIGLLLGSRTSQILSDAQTPIGPELPKDVTPIKINDYSDIQFLLPPEEETPKPLKPRGHPRKILKERPPSLST